ncbi:uncharacterized protein KY384_007445 [Bacidia gigantensis]|uniref:uncharacterized protein n=1 Tax=Bacidia gigantensis TaxID=2732470 RepID=UPI001D039300|nr:uncharacterized protein KY384_007445 [Bacidia gigantensis]KAG8528527.1 hypothetical protein KY384_007445 [Bacidia gigantensis]
MSRSTLYLQALFFVLISLSTATNISFGGGFDRHKCLVRTLNFLGNGTLAADDEVFYRDAAGRPMNGKDDLTLTLSGCEKLCGPRMMWYRDIGPRLSIWLIPILLLISNIELASLDKKRFFTILHLLGDPIDSIWSLVHKIDSWDQCYRLVEGYDNACDRCKRVMATVIAGFEELEGYELQPETIFDNLADRHDLTLQFEAWRRTAVKLADSRTNEIPRTCLAIVLYLFQLVAGFVKEVGGGSNSPVGGRIATGQYRRQLSFSPDLLWNP